MKFSNINDLAKGVLMYVYKIKRDSYIQDGGSSEKKYTIEYNDKIELVYKKISKSDNNIDIYLSNDFNDNCITVQINKKLRIGSIHSISNTEKSCFNSNDFILKHQGEFYLDMTIKLLKKYKEKFSIDKLTLIDNAVIHCKKGDNFNLSQFLLLTKGYTWYEKFGFKITDKSKQDSVNKSKDVIKQMKIKDIDFDKIFKDIKENKKEKYKLISSSTIDQIKKIISTNQNESFMSIMDFIFGKNKNDDTCLLYSLIINRGELLAQIKTKYTKFSALGQLEYYLDIV